MEKIPKTFSMLVQISHGIADRAWANMASFLTAQSVLVLAWAQLLDSNQFPGRNWILYSVSAVGTATSLLWAMLGTRMWDYHRAYEKRLERMILARSFGDRESDLTIWAEVNEEINKSWGRGGMLSKPSVANSRLRRARQWLYWKFVSYSGNH